MIFIIIIKINILTKVYKNTIYYYYYYHYYISVVIFKIGFLFENISNTFICFIIY